MSDDAAAEPRARLGATGALLSRLIHDLKQPLNLVRVTAQDVRLDAQRDRLDPATVPESMRTIEREIDELARVLEGLRGLARAAGEADADARADVAAACEAAVQRVRRAHPDVPLRATLPAELGEVSLPRADLEQALCELLDNGARAAAERGTSVALAARVDDQQLHLEIADGGGGVLEADQERVFAPFFTTRRGAAGIGLPLAQALVAPAQGRVALLRSAAEGSVFHIVLPRRC